MDLLSELLGASFVWSDEGLHDSLADYAETRSWPANKIVAELIERGAPLQCVVNVKDLQKASGTIFVANVHLLPEQAVERLLIGMERPFWSAG